MKSGGIVFFTTVDFRFSENNEVIEYIYAYICDALSSHFFKHRSVPRREGREFLYGGRYRRASGIAPFFRPGNTSKGILFHPQIYESPQIFRLRCIRLLELPIQSQN